MQATNTRAVMVALAMLVSGLAVGQPYPNHPVRMVIGSAPGAGVMDIMGRLVGQPLSTALGQPVIFDNRPGAGGSIATEAVTKSAPDGYTMLTINVSLAVNSFLYPGLTYDPLRDLVPVTMINSAPLMLLVHPSVAAKTVKELIAEAKARPGQLNYASGGVGSTPHLAAELFKSLAGIDVTHVPYKSGPPAIADLLGGQVAMMVENMPGTMPYVRSGKLRALAVTSLSRSPQAPALPTMSEAGVPGYEVIGWNGILVPKGTPAEIVNRLNTELAKILRSPEMRERMAALGADPVGNTPEEFGAFIRAEMARWGKIIKAKGVRAE
jgi:tripartite-type tricarboxylate transporter receptor subunit TctC